MDVLSLNESSAPSQTDFIDLTDAGTSAGIEIGAANSVAVFNGLVAVVIENNNKQEDGLIALYRSDDLSLITTFKTGALPDMVGFLKMVVTLPPQTKANRTPITVSIPKVA